MDRTSEIQSMQISTADDTFAGDNASQIAAQMEYVHMGEVLALTSGICPRHARTRLHSRSCLDGEASTEYESESEAETEGDH